MGTGYSVAITDFPPDLDRLGLKAGIERILATVDARMSSWRADSEISLFNFAGSPSWTGVSTDTLSVVDQALRVSRLSGGAFDPTIGPLVDLWGFGPGQGGPRVPSPRRVGAALRRTGFRHIHTSASRPAIAKSRTGVEIDLSGIAKGFAVDRLAEHLNRQGIADYLVEVGGELRARGHSPRGKPWRVGIERPVPGRRAVQRIVGLAENAIATSGDYRNFFDRDGSRFSHIIDPRSGEPVAHDLASVTVIAPSTMEADALSTALMVLGPDAGLRLAERENLSALFIVRDGSGFAEIGSSGFDHHQLA